MSDVYRYVAVESFSSLPPENPEAHGFTVTVEWRGESSWAVKCRTRCLNVKTREWDYEPMPSSRTKTWLRKYRFTDRDAAVAAAIETLLDLTVNGLSAAEVLAIQAERGVV